jgi:iron complex transport system substrate-binding protein
MNILQIIRHNYFLIQLFWFVILVFLIGLIPGPVQTPLVHGDRVVTDMTGRDVVIEGPAKRVFVLTPVLWHYLSASPDAEPIVKIPPYMRREFGASILGRLFPALEDKATAFTNFGNPGPISVEEVLWSEPDVALVWDYMSQGLESINFRGLVKIAGDGGDKTKLFNALGQLTGREERVRQLWERHRRELNEVAADAGECRRPTKVAVLGGSGLNLWGAPSQRHFFENLRLVCGVNVADVISNQNGLLNVENLIFLDPDVIYLNPYVLEQTDMEVGAVYSDPRRPGLKAVREKRVYHMPLGGSRLEGPVEISLSTLWTRLTMRPEIPTKLDLRRKIRETYLEVYDYEMSEEEIDRWLRLEENVVSAFYGRFVGKTEDDEEKVR